MRGRKIKWKNIYYPAGGWFDEEGNEVELEGNFRANYKDKSIIVVKHTIDCRDGSSNITAKVPLFFNSEDLFQLYPGNDFIEVIETYN